MTAGYNDSLVVVACPFFIIYIIWSDKTGQSYREVKVRFAKSLVIFPSFVCFRPKILNEFDLQLVDG